MTPKQLAELEVYLAAGFDVPTAIAMVTPDEGDSSEPEPASEPASPPPPTAWHYFVAIAAVIVVLWLIYWPR